MSKFEEALDIMRDLHRQKNNDYSSAGEFDNFEITAKATGLSVEMVILVQIANKIARLNALNKTGKQPNFESLEDTWKDLATYSTIGYSYFLKDKKGTIKSNEPDR